MTSAGLATQREMTQLCTAAHVTRICGSAQDEQESGEQSEEMGTVCFDSILLVENVTTGQPRRAEAQNTRVSGKNLA